MPWEAGAHPLERKKVDPAHPIALLEFAVGFADPAWCARGHVGYVLQGTLRLEFGAAAETREAARSGIETVNEGEGFVIDPGTLHRASNPGSVPVRLVIASSEAPVKGASENR